MKYLHTMVRVTDLEVSLAFYRDALGLEVLRVQEVPSGRFTLAFWRRLVTTKLRLS